jgi:uncharacterized phiE125 gp8 family phage protein
MSFWLSSGTTGINGSGRGLRLITPPSIKPLTLTEAKAHLRIDTPDEDTLITLLIDAATTHVDGPTGFLGRALVDQTWDLILDTFPLNEILIPLPPLIQVTQVNYDDTAGVQHTLPTDQYTVDNAREPGWILPTAPSAWPATFAGINAVRIRFRAGYVDLTNSPPPDVPGDIKAAMLLMLGSLYANREQVVAGQAAVVLPWGADQLLRRKRIDLSMG